MAGGERWYFTKEQLQNTPSRKCGMDADKELSYRQQATNIIQELGQRLQVTQLCINTGIVYMHRFYMFHSFTKFHRNAIAACALFLAAKVEEQPRKLEHVIRVAHMCLHREVPPLDVKSDAYQEQAHELVVNENIMLQTLGFDIAIEHPHTSVVKFCDLVRANKDLAQTSYFMATNSLHLTTMCLQYKPTVVACVCIHLAKKWSSWEIPKSNEGKDWFYYVDKTVTLQQIEELTSDFLAILDKCPSRLKQKQSSCNMNSGSISGISGIGSTPFPSIRDKKRPIPLKTDPKQKPTSTKPMPPSESGTQPSTSNHSSSQNSQSPNRKLKPTPTLVSNKTTSQGSASVTPSLPPQIQPPDKKVSYSLSAYNEKKEKERSVSSSREIAAPPVMREKERKPIEKVSSSLSRDIATRIPPNQQQVSSKLPPSTTDRLKQPDDKNKGRLKLQEQHNSDIVKSNTSMQPANPEQYFDSGVATQNFYDSLMNKPANFFASGENSNPGVPKINWDNPSTDGEDSSTDIKKEIASDLKMEFSDNDSNVSGSGSFSLASLPSLMPTEQGFQVKTEPSTQVKIEPSIQVKAEPKSKPPHTQSRNSFMSIFATEPSVNNSENRISNSHYNASLNSILEEKPAQLPPILSPLEPDPVTTTRKGKSPCVAAPQAEEIVSHDTPNIHIPNSHLSPTIMKIKQEPKATPTNSKAARGKSPEDSSYEIKKSTAEGLVTENVAKEALNLKEKHHHRGHHHHHHHHHKHEKHHKEKKHKHKNKDKDKDKHKSKERGSEKESQDSDSSKLKITLPVPKDRYVQDPDILNKSPIKLKISKKKLSDDFGGERVPEEPPKSLRIVIPKDRLSGNISSQESSSRKRKSSPRDASSSREKVARMDNDKHVSGNGSASVHVEKKDHSSDKKRMFSSSSLNCPIPQNQSAILNNYPPEHQQGVSTVHNVPAVNQNQRRYK